jgi:hypothetical protein
MRRCGVAILALLLRAPVWALMELPVRLSVGYEGLPAADLSHPQTGTFEENVKVKASVLKASVSFPQRLDSLRTMLVQGVAYQHYDFAFDNWDSAQETLPPTSLHALRYTLMVAHSLQENQRLIAVLSPGVYSDFHNVQWDHARLNGAGVWDYRFVRSDIGLGLSYGTNFGKPSLFPFLHWGYFNGTDFRVSVNIPAKAEVWWFLDRRVHVGLLAGFSGGQFRIGEAGPYQDKVVRFSTGKFGPALDMAMTDDLSLKIEGGVAFRRRYGIFDGREQIKSLDSKGSGFIQASVSYKIGNRPEDPDMGLGNLQ